MTCASKSHLAPFADKIVVSEIGEQWSPKSPPDSTEAIARCIGAFKATAAGTAIVIIMEKVPQELPVEKEIIALAMKMITGNTHAGTVSAACLQQTPDHPWLWLRC